MGDHLTHMTHPTTLINES